MKKYKAHVVIEQFDSKNYINQLAKILDNNFSLKQKLKKSKKVFIKPNLVTDNPEYIKNGANTDYRIVEALLAYLNTFPKLDIVIGESETGTKVKGRRLAVALKYLKIAQLQKKYRFRICNLSHDKKRTIVLKKGAFIKKIEMGVEFLTSDLIFDLPKIKTHKYSTITSALKNMFGAIPDPMRIIYHQNIHQVLADLNSYFAKKTFVITDGIAAMEGSGPIYGTPRKLGIIMVSDNVVANDIAACRIMKINPATVKHITLAQKWMKLKEKDISIISYTKPENISKKPFEGAHRNLFIRTEGFLMQFPWVVKILFNDFIRSNITRRFHHITDRLRGGSYTWFEDHD